MRHGQEAVTLPMSGAERARRYRARRRLERGTGGLVLVGPNNQSARRHGAEAADLEDAVQARLAELPQYLTATAFRDSVEIVFRRVERSRRLGVWISGLSDEEACTPRKAGGSSPEEIARHADDSAIRGLAALGMTPASAAKFAHQLERSLQPDLAQIAAQARLEGWAEGSEGA